MTLAIPDELRERMAEHPEIKWTEVIRAKLKEFLDALEEVDELSSTALRMKLGLGDEEITEKDITLARKVAALRDEA